MNEHKHRLKQSLLENAATAQNHLPHDQAAAVAAAPLILITDQQQLHQRNDEALDTIDTSKTTASSNLSIISTLPLPNAGSFNSSLTTSVSSSLSASSSSSSSTTNLNQQASIADYNSPSKLVSSSSNCSSSNHQQQQQSLKPDSLAANSMSLSHDTPVTPVVVTQISNYYNDHLVGHGHFFSKKTFHKPTYCHHCTEMLWGLIGQGFICEGLSLQHTFF